MAYNIEFAMTKYFVNENTIISAKKTKRFIDNVNLDLITESSIIRFIFSFFTSEEIFHSENLVIV